MHSPPSNASSPEDSASIPTEPIPLLDWIPLVSPHLDSPYWLAPLTDTLQRALIEPVRLVVNTPPQHGKSQTIMHWLAWVTRYFPRRLLYLAYNDDFVIKQMREARSIFQRAECEWIENTERGYHLWRFPRGGGVDAMGLTSGVTGLPGKLIVMDDPLKGWREAQSRTIRDGIYHEIRSSVLTRMHPDSSVVVVQTRWHEDDPSGRLIKDGWDHINLPAIGDDGVPLWPEGRPIDWLEEQRSERGVGPVIFEALYQGRPRPRGMEVFGPPAYYDGPAPTGRTAIGVDLAYTARTHADYSVALVLAERAGDYYITDLVRRQVKAPDFGVELRALAQRHPGAPLRWYAAGTEKGAADFLVRDGVPLTVAPTLGDKYVRAQPVSAAWNAGKILVPRSASWTRTLVDELAGFTGVNDPHDDIVDALAAAFDQLSAAPTGVVRSGGESRMRSARWSY